MIWLEEYDLSSEWDAYLNIYKEYLRTVIHDKKELMEILTVISGEEHKNNILRINQRKDDKFFIFKILRNSCQIGFCDFVCYKNENGKGLIGNFYLYPDFRNKGYGSEAYLLLEKKLIGLGATYIDITPEEKAQNFYLRKGFVKTEDLSLENGETVYRKSIFSEFLS